MSKKYTCYRIFRQPLSDTFARQALAMVWDFSEINPLGNASGNVEGSLDRIVELLRLLAGSGTPTHVRRTTATKLPFSDEMFDAIVTDPPYYDNISYADLADFFYVWLRRAIGHLYPEHFGSDLSPRKQEAVVVPPRPYCMTWFFTNSRDVDQTGIQHVTSRIRSD